MVRFRDIVLRVQNGAGLFGTCTGWYGMVEAQGRGTLHCHMLVWISNNPSPKTLRELLNGDDFKERMLTWLERIIKTELPGDSEVVVEPNGALPMPTLGREDVDPRTCRGPDLRRTGAGWRVDFDKHVTDLVKRNNWHEHRATCWIHLRPNEARSDDKCRMRIDGSTRARSEVDAVTGSILLRRLHPRINEYNDVVMFLFKCNMDIQYLGSGEASKAALYYITDYITKASLKVHAGLTALIYAIQKNNEKFEPLPDSSADTQSKSLVTKMLNSIMSRQEMSHQQVMSYYVGGGDHYTTHRFARLQWGYVSNQVQRMESSIGGDVSESEDHQAPGVDEDVDA
ncbi:hypothetical protein CALVIDRAFT_481063, partial [Calocera viscosa TUFC12733]